MKLMRIDQIASGLRTFLSSTAAAGVQLQQPYRIFRNFPHVSLHRPLSNMTNPVDTVNEAMAKMTTQDPATPKQTNGTTTKKEKKNNNNKSAAAANGTASRPLHVILHYLPFLQSFHSNCRPPHLFLDPVLKNLTFFLIFSKIL